MNIKKLSISAILIILLSMEAYANSKRKTSINLTNTSTLTVQNKNDYLKALLPKEEITEFDITTQNSILNPVASLPNLREEEGSRFKVHSAKDNFFLQEEKLTIEPEQLKPLLYPHLGQSQEDENTFESKARQKQERSSEQKEDIESFQMDQQQAMVQDLGNGVFEVDSRFERQIPTLLDMNKLAYGIGKRGTLEGDYDALIKTLKKDLLLRGWEIEEFSGKTGKKNIQDDTPGFVAYNKEENVMTVIVRGSQTREDDKGSPDWEVNFDAKLIDFPFGKVHNGFYNRTQAMLPNVQRAMDRFIDRLDKAAKSNLKIIISGHSQGAALASILTPLLAELYTVNGKFGSKFNNAISNVFQGYFISAPRVYSGDKSIEWVNRVVGEHNMIRQNVTGGLLADPVPTASPGRTITALISLIPFVGKKLANKYGGEGGTRSVGFLAADWSNDVLKRQLGNDLLSFAARYAKKSFWHTWDNLLNKNKKFEEKFVMPETRISFDTLLGPTIEGLSTLLAPLHYGSTDGVIEEGEALFKQDLVAGYLKGSPTMATLLAQGFEKKQSEQEGLNGFIRCTIENAARQKEDLNLPDLAAVASGIQIITSNAMKIATNGLKGAFSTFKRNLFLGQ